MKITFLGHASLLIEVANKSIIVDPFITANKKAKHIDINSLKADYILLTHAHEDHILDAEFIAKNTGAKIVSNFEIVNYYGKIGIEGHPMNHGGTWNFDFGRLTMVNAIHSSSFPDGSYGGNPAGFVLETKEGNIYIAGDTALTLDMKLISIQCSLNLAILPIGDNFTMGIDSAIIATDFVEADKVLAYHFDTFGYIEIDHEYAIQKFKKKNKELIILEIGKSITI
jgi:L-ascorbate metabolism protein UlaG (beta-lactamase superfamily)